MTTQSASPFIFSSAPTLSPFVDAPLTAVIADDEPHIARHIGQMLAKIAPDITVIAVTHDGDSTLRVLTQNNPSLVLLDINMPGLSGIEVAWRNPHTTDIIFVTAYEQHAATAFAQGAIDYILKPVSPDRLQLAIQRFYKHRQLKNAGAPKLLRINLMPKQTTVHVPENDILYMEAHGNYCYVYTVDGTQGDVRRSLQQIKSALNPDHFVQIHRACIINTRHIRRVTRQGHGAIVRLHGCAKDLRASRQYVPALISLSENGHTSKPF